MEHYELIAVFTPDGFRVEKEPAGDNNTWYDEKLYQDFLRDPYKTLYDFGFANRDSNISASLAFIKTVAERFIRETSHDSDLEITRKAKPSIDAVLLELLRMIPFATGIENISLPWLRAIWDKLRGFFDAEASATPGTVEKYLRGKNASINVVGRVFFHLVEHKSEHYPFAFLATYSTGSSENVSHMPLKNALIEYKTNQGKMMSLLAPVSRAAEKSAFICELLESGELFSALGFTPRDAYTFLKEADIYERCGIVCRIPDWWRKKRGARLSVSIGDREPSGVGLGAIMAFKPELHLGNMEMSRDEMESLLAQTNGLSFIKGKWVEVDRDKLKDALEAFDKVKNLENLTFAEAIRIQLGLEPELTSNGSVDMEITSGEWLRSVKSKLTHPAETCSLSVGREFRAVLRAYQKDGLSWLNYMRRLGFGALLADDMGLGKTVQILALLEYLRQNGGNDTPRCKHRGIVRIPPCGAAGNKESAPRSGELTRRVIKALLIIPASLIPNWCKEAERFAPKLRLKVVHSQSREFSEDEAELFITTYGMVMRLESLTQTEWDLVILDEAQAIKNPGNKQTQAVKLLKAKNKIAMTGTPIENRLSDLWSIFDFLNKGMLGTGKEFSSFAKGLKDDPSGYARLRDAVSPFILRRLKTDKAVISDLPDKLEFKSFTTLTKKQIVLYNTLVKDVGKALGDASGISRKGIVLASIMKFKQICNHPDQYLGQPDFEEKYSGKFKKLSEICETIREKRERVLVFTQFREITKPLTDFLTSVFGREGLVLHGGTPVKKRGELVEHFNGREYVPFMVLSLKAGGVGLNLASANHVIHFDRWWNPAIENQATDRAFRIGQHKNVIVHKFITAGTVEEKIDLILEEKQKLADDIITAKSGESWITEMTDSELIKLFTLEL